jgi:fluoride exporter
VTALGLLVGLLVAGALGSLLRHEVLLRSGGAGTVDRARAVALVNLVGALAVGGAVAASLPPVWLAIVAVGFAGSLTTFSTWMVEAVFARETGRTWLGIAALDLAGQLAVGVMLVVSVVGLT